MFCFFYILYKFKIRTNYFIDCVFCFKNVNLSHSDVHIIAENSYADINHDLDVWHGAKNFGKKVLAVSYTLHLFVLTVYQMKFFNSSPQKQQDHINISLRPRLNAPFSNRHLETYMI